MNPASSSRAVFSLVAGGPTYRLQQWLGLLEPGSPHLARRAALSIVLTWAPLLVLSAAQGIAIGHDVKIPFLYDYSAYARFLVAIPLLIFAEGVVERNLAEVAGHFMHSGLVPEDQYPAHAAALDYAIKLRDSLLAEMVLMGLTVMSVLGARDEFLWQFSTWHSLVSGSAHVRTWAGWWYQVVGMTLFQFLLWRWLWRMVIWYGFLWRMSRLKLRLIPTHPDRAAGLGFVGDAQRFFWLIVVAVAVTMAGVLGNEIIFGGTPLATYTVAIFWYVVAVLLVFLGPLLMFLPQLARAKIKSVHDYSTMAVMHNQMFDSKWVKGDNPKGECVLGTPDISSLADLGGAYEVLDRMRSVPFDPADAIALALAALIPLAPLLLSVYPFGRLLEVAGRVLL